MAFNKTRRGKDTRIPGIVVISSKQYAIKLIIFPKEGSIVEVMSTLYKVKKIKFKEVKFGIVPVIYLIKTITRQKKKK